MQNKTKKAGYLTKRVKKAHGAAGFAGTLYFLGNIALLAMVCLGMFATNASALWVMNFYQPIVDVINGAQLTADVFCNVVAGAVYGLILVFGLINVIRSFSKLGWLGKKTASAKYGFNRPEYAMEDLGRIFSDTFHAVVFLGLIAYIFYGATTVLIWGIIAAAVGIVIHFVAGLVGGNVSLFVIDNQVTEQKREYGSFSVFLRNFFQIAAVAGIGYGLIQLGGVKDFVVTILGSGYKDPMAMISPICQVVVLVWLLFLSKHATNITEFDQDGPKAPGMKNFTVFSIFTAITMIASIVVEVFVRKSYAIEAITAAPQLWTLIIAGIGLVMFIIQLIMSKFPLVKKSVLKERAAVAAAMLAAAQVPARTRINFNLIDKPGIITLGGHQYMVMPLTYSTEDYPVEENEYDGYEFYYASEEENV